MDRIRQLTIASAIAAMAAAGYAATAFGPLLTAGVIATIVALRAAGGSSSFSGRG